MRLGVLLMPTDPWPETVAHARRLEAMGFHHLWVYDHLTWQRYQDRDWYGIYTWLAALAASTERVGLGTMVANPNIRHPYHLAKDAMTIDQISAGRMILGLGAGGTGFDANVFGQSALSPGQRIDRLAEYVEVVDGLLRGTLTDHTGDWYRISGARMAPGCVQRPRVPLALAAGGPRALALAARYAEGWITFGDNSGRDLSPEGTERAVRAQSASLDEACAAVGRDPGELARYYLVGNTAERPLSSVDAFEDFCGRYGALGFTDIVFHHPRPDDQVWTEPVEIVERIAERMLRG